ncbi:hypothetical protein KHP62_21935, partial [Rhodobacteraceae bacterium NNCM2]|nr:hypothetical protein [Coraliihabitans acroporae]
MNNFYSQVQTHTGTINSTLNDINSGSTSAQNSTAQAAISKAVTNIISAATSANSALKTSKRDLETRTYSALDQQIISGTSANAITSIAGTMGLVQGKFGAGYTGGLIGGLIGALGLVLGTLDAIVGDVLMLAGALVG